MLHLDWRLLVFQLLQKVETFRGLHSENIHLLHSHVKFILFVFALFFIYKNTIRSQTTLIVINQK